MNITTDSFISEVLKLYELDSPQRLLTDPELSIPVSHQTMTLPYVNVCNLHCLQELHDHIKLLFKTTKHTMGYERAFNILSGHDLGDFKTNVTLYLDQLRQQLDQGRHKYSEEKSRVALEVVSRQFKTFMDSKYTLIYDYDSQMTEKCFLDHTGVTIDTFRDVLQQRIICVKEFIEEGHHDTCQNGDSIVKVQEMSCVAVDESDKLQNTGSVIT